MFGQVNRCSVGELPRVCVRVNQALARPPPRLCAGICTYLSSSMYSSILYSMYVLQYCVCILLQYSMYVLYYSSILCSMYVQYTMYVYMYVYVLYILYYVCIHVCVCVAHSLSAACASISRYCIVCMHVYTNIIMILYCMLLCV